MEIRRFMRKVRRSFRYGEKGFTLIELLIVVAILGILAAVVLPNVGGFLHSGHIAAANSEVASCKTASAAYYAAGGTYPATEPTAFDAYLDRTPKSTYTFDAVTHISGSPSGGWANAPYSLVWNSTNQTWE